MRKFKEILRTGVILGGMVAAEDAMGQEVFEESKQSQVNSESIRDSSTKIGIEKINPSSLDDFKIKLKRLSEQKNKGQYSESFFLSEAVARFDEYSKFPGADDFLVECGEKYLKDLPNYFFSNLENVSSALPVKFESLIIRAAKEYPLQALHDDNILKNFEKIYPQIILATLNKELLSQNKTEELIGAYLNILKAKTTHPASEILKDILNEKLKNKARENPQEIFQLAMGNLEEWSTNIFPEKNEREEFLYIFLSGLIGKGNTEEIFSDFELFAKYEMCRSLLFVLIEKTPERVLQVAEGELGGVRVSGASSLSLPDNVRDFYFFLISESLLKAKVGEGQEDYDPSPNNWGVIKFLYPQAYENLQSKFGNKKELREIFGKDAKLELNTELKDFLSQKGK